MPIYTNPNNHIVTIRVTSPPIAAMIYPEAWQPSRVPQGGLREVQLDAAIAKEFVKIGMLKVKPEDAPPLLTKESVVELVKNAADQGLAHIVHQEARKALPPASLPPDERPAPVPEGAPPSSVSSRKRRSRYAE